MNVSEAQVLTANFSNEIFFIPEGARTIDINNIGLLPITFEGNSNLGNLVLSPATIVVGESYSFAYLDKPYPNITLDCTGSICEISVTY
jgi:hypothetical protein